MNAVALAIFSAISGAVANLLARTVTRFAPTRDVLAINFGLMFLILLPAAPFFLRLDWRLVSVGTLLAAAGIDLAANYFYFRSFEELDAITASSVLSLSPAVSLFFVPLFRIGSDIPAYGFAGIILVSGGLVILSREARNHGESAAGKAGRAIWLPLAAALLYGFNVFVIKVLFDHGWTNPYTYYLLRAFLIAAVWFALFKPDHRWLTRRALLVTSARLTVVIAQWMALLAALALGHPAGVKALADSSPLFVLILNFFLTGEKINVRQALGALVILAGMSLIAVAGS